MQVSAANARLGISTAPVRKSPKKAQKHKPELPGIPDGVTKEQAVAALGMRYAPSWLRKAVLERDGYKCRYCKREVRDDNCNIDHLKPWPYGMTEMANLMTSCRPCNQAKRSSESWRWRAKASR